MSIGSDLGRSLTGNIESAYITIHDFRKHSKANAELKAAMITKALNEGTGDFAISKAANKRFRVQFNPSEMQVYATTDPVEKINIQKKEGSEEKDTLVDAPVGARLEMTVNLVFDHMYVANSFMMEKNLLPTSVSGITNIALSAKEGDGVQKEVEGFISALRNQYTQLVTFNWADFTFTGTLINVSAQYIMFSMSGLPVRAKVMLRMRQEAGSQNMQTWLNDFDDAFSGNQSNLVRPEQRASNLVNIGL